MIHEIPITHIEVHLHRAAPGLDGLRICHFSDLHADRIGRVERAVVRSLAKIEADLVAYTGDFTNGSNDLEACLEIMGAIKPRLGTFAVYGNNDHNKGVDVDLTTRLLARQGVQVLTNAHIHLPEQNLWVLGVDDPYKKLDDVGRALQGIPREAPKVLLAHTAGVIEQAIEAEIDLVLAGHTHGGQITLPGGRAIWGHSRHGTRLVWGYFPPEKLRRRGFPDARKTHLFVTRGIGTSLIPVRLFCPAEIALITLRAQPDTA